MSGCQFANPRESQPVAGKDVRESRTPGENSIKHRPVGATLQDGFILNAAASEKIRVHGDQFHLETRDVLRMEIHRQRLRRQATFNWCYLGRPQQWTERSDRAVAFHTDAGSGRQAFGHHRLDKGTATGIAEMESFRILLGDYSFHPHQIGRA